MEDFAPTDRRFSINWGEELKHLCPARAQREELDRRQHAKPPPPYWPMPTKRNKRSGADTQGIAAGPGAGLGSDTSACLLELQATSVRSSPPQWPPRAKPVGRNDQDAADARWVCRYTPGDSPVQPLKARW